MGEAETKAKRRTERKYRVLTLSPDWSEEDHEDE
jgi:hypothetical protein